MNFFNKQSIIHCNTYYNKSYSVHGDDVLIILGSQIIKRYNMDSDFRQLVFT